MPTRLRGMGTSQGDSSIVCVWLFIPSLCAWLVANPVLVPSTLAQPFASPYGEEVGTQACSDLFTSRRPPVIVTLLSDTFGATLSRICFLEALVSISHP